MAFRISRSGPGKQGGLKGAAPALKVLVLKKAMKDPRTAMVSIRDMGTGIDGKHGDRIFEPCFTTKPEGLGVGLCISRAIITAHLEKMGARSLAELVRFAEKLIVGFPRH